MDKQVIYDIIVKGGEVIDPAQGIRGQRDVGISSGRIAAVSRDIPASRASKVVNARGKIVSPGLIDSHLHVADGITPTGLSPDTVGVLSGVTAVCDGGSTGHINLLAFQRHVIPHARTDVFGCLHVCPAVTPTKLPLDCRAPRSAGRCCRPSGTVAP